MYINPIFWPFYPHLHHFSFGECERSLGVRAHLVFVRKRGSNIKFGKFFIPKPNFQVRKLFQVLKLNFSVTSLSISTQSTFLQTWKLFIHRTFHETNQPTLNWIHIFYPKLMKDISFLIETCFFMIHHENFKLYIHVSNLSFLVEILVLHMKLVVWIAWQVCNF